MDENALIKVLRALEDQKVWTKEKAKHKADLIEIAGDDAFYRYIGRAELFPSKRLPHIGETACTRVPETKRGRFARFAGQEVVAICLANSSQYDRQIAVILSAKVPALRAFVLDRAAHTSQST